MTLRDSAVRCNSSELTTSNNATKQTHKMSRKEICSTQKDGKLKIFILVQVDSTQHSTAKNNF